MATHPLHDIFSTVDTLKAADGTTLRRQLRCDYCPKTWELHQYPTGERQGKWRVVELNQLRLHMLNECSYRSNNDIRRVASATSVRDALAYVDEIRSYNRRWPPQSPCTSLFADDASSAMPHDSSSTLPHHDCEWVQILNRNGQVVADWNAADRDAWLRHMPWKERDNDQLNTILGKLVCTAGCPARIVESGAVHELADMVHPRAKARVASTVTRNIISALAREAQEWSKQRLRDAKYVTILTDLWTAARRRSVCAHLAVTDQREVVIVHAPERTGERHDADMITRGMRQAIAMVDAASASPDTPSLPPDSIAAGRSKVVAVMTDAASCNTVAAERLLPRYPGLQWETCNVHRMNNLVKRLCSFAAYKKLLKDAQGVVAAVAKNNTLNSLFDKWRLAFHQHELPATDEMREKFGDANRMQREAIDDLAEEHKARYGPNAAKPSNTGLISAAKTRFASYVSLLDSLAHNRPVLRLLAACYSAPRKRPL
jgi:hypothetical protein